MVKLFRLHQVAVHTVVAGKVDDLVLAFKGIIGKQQRIRIAYTTRRGLHGKGARGGATGDACSATAVRSPVRRARARARPTRHRRRAGRTRPPHLPPVRRWLEPQADLQRPQRRWHPPRARERGKYNAGVWNPSTLSGNVTLGEGSLNNELYIGRRIFNHRTWVEVPNERRGFSRRPRLHPEAEWLIRNEPQLRIIDQDLWEQVKVLQVEARSARDAKFKLTSNPLAGAKRPAHMLSRLVTCGICGAPFLATGAGRWRCKGHRTGTCDNGSIITTELETRALAGIRGRLLTPALIKRFAALLQQELTVAA